MKSNSFCSCIIHDDRDITVIIPDLFDILKNGGGKRSICSHTKQCELHLRAEPLPASLFILNNISKSHFRDTTLHS